MRIIFKEFLCFFQLLYNFIWISFISYFLYLTLIFWSVFILTSALMLPLTSDVSWWKADSVLSIYSEKYRSLSLFIGSELLLPRDKTFLISLGTHVNDIFSNCIICTYISVFVINCWLEQFLCVFDFILLKIFLIFVISKL